MREFYQSAIQEPHTILGLRLLPLSIGHVYLLNRVESAFIAGGKITFDDLAVSVLICSRTYREALDMFADPTLDRQMRRWAQRLTSTRPIDRLLRRKPKPINLAAKAAAFRAYMDAGSWRPGYKVNGECEGNDIDLPQEQIVRTIIMRDLHVPDSEIWDRSWSQSLTDICTLKALDGSIMIIDPEEIAKLVADMEERMANADATHETRN